MWHRLCTYGWLPHLSKKWQSSWPLEANSWTKTRLSKGSEIWCTAMCIGNSSRSIKMNTWFIITFAQCDFKTGCRDIHIHANPSVLPSGNHTPKSHHTPRLAPTWFCRKVSLNYWKLYIVACQRGGVSNKHVWKSVGCSVFSVGMPNVEKVQGGSITRCEVYASIHITYISVSKPSLWAVANFRLEIKVAVP